MDTLLTLCAFVACGFTAFVCVEWVLDATFLEADEWDVQ